MVARDGSPVDLYASMPAFGEADIVHAAIPAGAEILELGCGAGRMTRELLRLGHPVIAVDESREMLARVSGARTVWSRIEQLVLRRRMPVVLLASRVVNQAERSARSALLAACRRHVADDGAVLIETYPRGWHPEAGSNSARGGLSMTLVEASWDGGVMTGVVEYELNGRRWRHGPFRARPLHEDELRTEMTEAGLHLERWLDEARTWLLARPTAISA
jgi:SAM-dependent methyltransferase